MTYKSPAKICAALSILSIVLVVWLENDSFWWGFFIFLAFAILFQKLEQQEETIETLRSPKKEETEEEKQFAKFTGKKRQEEMEVARNSFALSSESRKELHKQMGLIKDEKKDYDKKR